VTNVRDWVPDDRDSEIGGKPMETATTYETVLPRPVDRLPTSALAAATRKLADKLSDNFALSDDAAAALAQAVVDPAAARRAVESPERLPVPGGAVLAVRTEVWARCIMPDPRNPRIGPARRHPASDLVGRDEGSRFRPLPDPDPAPDSRAELVVRLQNQEHLAWAAQQATEYIFSSNDWRESIKHQGVMTEIWLAATTFDHGDNTPSVTVPVTVEGSSRITAVHDLLGVRSADVPYSRDERRLRHHIRKLNEATANAGNPDALDNKTAVMLRCEVVPALLLVGFEAHRGDTTPTFAVAVKSLVALRHVDFPKPWGEATENEALADAVLNELEARGLITPGKADWLAGALTPEEARNAGFSADPTVRAATIIRLFTDRDPRTHEAVRVAITSQSTRKQIRTKLLFEIATSLVLRSVPEPDAHRREQVRKYLKDAYSQELAGEWTATLRSADELATAALGELHGDGLEGSSRELAARAAYPLIVNGHLYGDRGARNNDQPDRRKPGEVIDRMRSSQHGILQLRQALTDFAADQRIRRVHEDGTTLRNDDGHDVLVRDADLRGTFSPPGHPPATPAPETTAEILRNTLAEVGTAFHALDDAVKRVESVVGDDGRPAIDVLGADGADCQAWQQILIKVLQKLPLWQQTHAQRLGTVPSMTADDLDEGLDSLDDDAVDEDDMM